ncbi:MAG: sodium ion-translocating decarboxylase subunit beta [Propionibacteriaceae bacterium]|nr:sodium ion-translocating decarboxylase subunit beta [Propionibacteriaceae bacterium]
MNFFDTLSSFVTTSGFANISWQQCTMLLIAFVLIYLAIVKKFEPLLLLPIAFGMFLANLPLGGITDLPVETMTQVSADYVLQGGEHFVEMVGAGGEKLLYVAKTTYGGLLYYLGLGVKLGIFPPLIFLGVGAMTDFGPLIANPKSILLGGAAQLGIFMTFIGALALGFTPQESGSIGIIGGADGPTALFLTAKMAPHLLGPIAVAAYSYMALVPVIQPPIMKLLTTKRERQIVMKQLRPVSRRVKVLFPIVVTAFVALILPATVPLIGMLMLGNLLKECGVVERLNKTVQNELMNIVTIFLGISVGSTATAQAFLNPQTLQIIVLGVVAFGFGTAGGVLMAKLMNTLSGGNAINPLIGSAGVSAVPMAARVSQVVGQKENPNNFLLMHAMGPNVAGVIGSAIAAGILLSAFG